MLVPIGDEPEVVAIVPTLGADLDRLARCLTSLDWQDTDTRLAAMVVLNGDDATAEEVAAISPAATCVEKPGLNTGWGGGLAFGRAVLAAQGVTPARLWMVQDDTVLAAESLAWLGFALDQDPGLGLVSPVALDAVGAIPRHSLGGTVSADCSEIWFYPGEDLTPDRVDGFEQLTFLASRGCLVRLDAWDQAGGTDPMFYPAYYADTDLGMALAAVGWRLRIVPEAVISHDRNASSPAPYARFLMHRNVELFRSKWGPEGPRAPRPPQLHPALTGDLLAGIAGAAAATLRAVGRELP